ncbi:trypsin-like peptidase domain-containing protein [Paenibacillus barcinonensis]|uniref:Trypsin-like peptidase n=1 Tax=Paenibacillus barcinonensis TaxID=198119 RepID=A0A2V4VZW7_PAEBA|nr:serine protease [Paenibacillus barcinonensis]PYE47648.1 trypsin-like peptidase [Paenibacillus barcinonensis]QKS58521.1 trypsin-like peptidase domain-containing protein [Paenibacillus barcinonensis]
MRYGQKVMTALLGFLLMVVCLGSSAESAITYAEGGRSPQVFSEAEQVYSSAAQAVFYLKAYRKDGTLKTVGSGFVIENGQALTAAHVVKDAVSYEAVFEDGSVQKLLVLGVDGETDVALLSVKDTLKRPALALSVDRPSARHGQRSFAIGYPLKDGKIITEGIVNAPMAEVNDVTRLLTSAQVSPGMSGGPLLNEEGRVIGLISGSFRTMNGIHICVTVEDMRKLLKKSNP